MTSVYADDPTKLSGALKLALSEKKEAITVEQKKIELVKEDSKQQEIIEKLVFKAFYTKDSIHRLMLQFEASFLLLEEKDDFELGGEFFTLKSFNDEEAQLIHKQSNTKIIFTYRRTK